MNGNNQNCFSNTIIYKNINDIEQLINLILFTSENAASSNHHESLFKLLQEEKNEIQLTTNLLEILSNFNQCINKLSSLQNLHLLIYIKNILLKFKAKPKLKNITNFEQNVLSGINFYLNFNFNNDNDDNFKNIKKIYDEIIPSLFDLIVVMKEPKNFLQLIYDKIILIYLKDNNNTNYILSHDSIIKFIFVYESFCRIYLIYIVKNSEISIIFEKYLNLLQFCKNFCLNYNNIQNQKDINELNAKLINQCILSFSKTSMLSLDNFIKSQILYIFPEIKGNNEYSNEQNDKKYIFINNNSFLEFVDSCFYYDNNKNIFSFGIEYANNKEQKFNFLLSKGKGILIELITVLIKKLTKYELFNTYENFNTQTFNYYCNIINYLKNFYQNAKGNYPREKADNSPEEIIQLSVIVKLINFIDEIIDNKIYNNLIETNLFIINSSNKNEKYEEIFKYIIVPNLLQTELEKTFFEFDQDEYLKNLLDMCHICEVKLPKQKSIKLLMTLCDSVNGFLSIIVHVYILILKNISLNNNNISKIEIEDKYKSLYFFLTQNINSFNLIEQSLQVLTSVSYLFGDKPEISDYFCDEIDLINYMLIKISDPFLKTKLCVFYSYNLEILFHNDDEVLSKSFDDSLNFLFDCIFNKTSNDSLKKVAFNSLNEIIFNNYLKKFCITSVSIYALKIINYFNIKENLKGLEEEFNEFLKGIVKEYMFNLGDSIIQLFDLFWDKFLICLSKSETNEKGIDNFDQNINNLKNGVLKDKTKEVNNAFELNLQINTIKNFVSMVINKDIEIKKNIYEKILSLFPKLSLYIDTDFEEEILQLISKVISDIKLLHDSYFIHLKNYYNALNTMINKDDFRYKIENYHLDFIFTCFQYLKNNLLIKENIIEVLTSNLNSRLSKIPRYVSTKSIFIEDCLYCDMGLCIDIFFFSNMKRSNICELIKIFYMRMEKKPNSDYDLNVKLCINIFLLLIKNEGYDLFDEIFLNNKNINLYNFLCKVISFFPVKDLSLIQQQIIAIFCSLIIRYLIIKKKNNQKILINEERTSSDKDAQKIFYLIFIINLNQLNIIKNKSSNIISKNEIKKEELYQKTLNKEIIIDSYEINENNGKNHFKKNTKMVFKERTPHNSSILKKYDYANNDNDYFNDDEFLLKNEIKDDYNENGKVKNNKNDDESDDDGGYGDENMDPNEENNNNEDYDSDYDNNIYDDEENIDDKDEEFLTIKNDTKYSFMYFFNKFANEELIVFLKEINEFHLFEIMMKDIEINDPDLFKQLLNQIKTSQGENKLKLIEKFKGLQKIEFKDKNITYRKILKIQKK